MILSKLAAEAIEREERITRAMVLIGPLSDTATFDEIKRRTALFKGRGKRWPDILALESLAHDVMHGRWDS